MEVTGGTSSSVALAVEGLAEWGGPGEVLVGGGGHGPAVAVGDPVVIAAHEGQVRDVGGAAVAPPGDVVGVAPADGCVTAGEHAAAVACGEGSALVAVGEADLAAQVQRHPQRVHDQGGDDRVAQQAGGGLGVDVEPVRGDRRPAPLDQISQIPVPAGQSPLLLHFVYTDDGLYVPAGSAPLPSTAIMLAVPDLAIEGRLGSLDAETIATNAPLTVDSVKYIVGQAVTDESKRDLKKCDELVQACFASNDYKEGRKAFMEKRKPAFTGS